MRPCNPVKIRQGNPFARTLIAYGMDASPVVIGPAVQVTAVLGNSALQKIEDLVVTIGDQSVQPGLIHIANGPLGTSHWPCEELTYQICVTEDNQSVFQDIRRILVERVIA